MLYKDHEPFWAMDFSQKPNRLNVICDLLCYNQFVYIRLKRCLSWWNETRKLRHNCSIWNLLWLVYNVWQVQLDNDFFLFYFCLILGVPLEHRNLTFCYFRTVVLMARDKDIFFVRQWRYRSLSVSAFIWLLSIIMKRLSTSSTTHALLSGWQISVATTDCKRSPVDLSFSL